MKKPKGRAVVPSQAALAVIEAKVVARVAAKLKHFHQTELLTAIAEVNTRLDKQEKRLEAGDRRFDEQDKAILALTRSVDHIPVVFGTMMTAHAKDIKRFVADQFQKLNGQQQAMSDGLLLVREILDKQEGIAPHRPKPE